MAASEFQAGPRVPRPPGTGHRGTAPGRRASRPGSQDVPAARLSQATEGFPCEDLPLLLRPLLCPAPTTRELIAPTLPPTITLMTQTRVHIVYPPLQRSVLFRRNVPATLGPGTSARPIAIQFDHRRLLAPPDPDCPLNRPATAPPPSQLQFHSSCTTCERENKLVRFFTVACHSEAPSANRSRLPSQRCQLPVGQPDAASCAIYLRLADLACIVPARGPAPSQPPSQHTRPREPKRVEIQK
ncbi:hypothetical protein BC834DRAFT_496844 [Gloeopeniophorella convolvens]|nr:hypothetical protein BC834DRAFT_496844 [Gloeopeniophorella convolvens]